MFFFQEEFGVKMYVAQDTTDIDGIEHKPLKMTGEADKVEVRNKKMKIILAKKKNLFLSVLNNIYSIHYQNQVVYHYQVVLVQIQRVHHHLMIMVHE